MSIQREQIFCELKELLSDRGVFPAQETPSNTELKLLGIDSVEIALVFSHFEQKYDAMFENQEILGGKYKTLDDVIEVIFSRIHGKLQST